MQGRNAQSNSAAIAGLTQSPPRQVRLNASGIAVMLTAVALTITGVWGGTKFYRDAKRSGHQARLFVSEAVTTDAEVIRVQRRGGGNDRRSTIHYRYVAGGQQHLGATTVRRQDRDRYSAGAQVVVRYLASEPGASWMDGYSPRRVSIWPALIVPVACALSAFAIVLCVRRQTNLLTYGRPATAIVTKVQKKRSDKGTYWRVHYEWTLMSGARRQGHYKHGKRQPPAIGTAVPIVYHRDQPSRHSRYPLSLVALSEK